MRNTTMMLCPWFLHLIVSTCWRSCREQERLFLMTSHYHPAAQYPAHFLRAASRSPIMRLWPEPDVWCAELWLFQINYLMILVLYPLDARSLTCTPRLSRTEREKLAGNGFSNTIIIPVSFSHLKFQYHIVFNLISIHLNLFNILLKSNVATDRFKTQSLFPWNLDNFFLIVAGQIECKSTKI